MKKVVLLMSLFSSLSLSALAQDGSSNTSTSDRPRSHSGLFVEPMLIYSQNDSSIQTSQLPIITDDTSGTISEASLGARLGVHVGDIFILAADGRYGKSKFKDSSYSTADATGYNYGATAIVQTPIAGIQLFGTYILGGAFDPQAGAQNIDLKFTNARGYRVGGGIHIMAVSLNLEYQDITYNNSIIESAGPVALNRETAVDANQRGYAVSLGFPISL